MSAFMLPLEKEFGWTRAQTSWVTTIGIAMVAGWVRLRRTDSRSPRAAAGRGDRRHAVQPRLYLRELHAVADRGSS